MRTRTATSAGGVIVDPRGCVVLTARKSFKGELQWGLPKGLLEKGEEPAQAAAREAKEETGLEVEVKGLIEVIDYWYVEPTEGGRPPTRVHKFVHFFLMSATGGDPSAHDHETEEVAILEPAEAIARASFASERKVIAAAVGPGR